MVTLDQFKSRYVQYLKNIDALSNQTEDKHTALSANQWLCEKMDGKATATIEIGLDTTDSNDVIGNR